MRKIIFVLIMLLLPIEQANADHIKPVTRDDVLDIAKEMHSPGCTMAMTADYCKLKTAVEFRMEILEYLQQGMHKDEVMAKLVDRYGERILASPPTKGFQLTAWIVPFVAVLMGVYLVSLFVVKRSKQNESSQLIEEETLTRSKTENHEKIQMELQKYL